MRQALIVAIAATAVAACRRSPPLPDFGAVPAFELTRENGAAYSSEQLRGSVWVANFIFTRCPTVCPTFSAKMARIQSETNGFANPVRLVSFSVDPRYDTPDVLSAYAKKYAADSSRWAFLTGTHEALSKVIVDGFHMPLEPGTPGDLMSIGHGSYFVLIDGRMHVRGLYRLTDADVVAHVVEDARKL